MVLRPPQMITFLVTGDAVRLTSDEAMGRGGGLSVRLVRRRDGLTRRRGIEHPFSSHRPERPDGRVNPGSAARARGGSPWNSSASKLKKRPLGLQRASSSPQRCECQSAERVGMPGQERPENTALFDLGPTFTAQCIGAVHEAARKFRGRHRFLDSRRRTAVPPLRQGVG